MGRRPQAVFPAGRCPSPSHCHSASLVFFVFFYAMCSPTAQENSTLILGHWLS